MKVHIEKIDRKSEETVLIRCHEVTDNVKEIEAFVRSRSGSLSGISDAMQYEVAVTDICYIESVDGRTFLYTDDRVYETSYRIYELEEMLRPKHFLRISKPMLVNLMKIRSIQPAFNGRFTAVLRSGEQVIISRNYVKALKAALKGE